MFKPKPQIKKKDVKAQIWRPNKRSKYCKQCKTKLKYEINER